VNPERLLADETGERLARILRDVDPTPPEVYAQARASFARRFQELRQGGFPVPALPGQTPGGGGGPRLDCPPGLQRRSPAWGSQDGAEAAGADRVGGRKNPLHWRNTAPACLYIAGVAAFLLLAALARAIGLYAGGLIFLYLS
jgi:hypothetical protein